MSLKVIICDDSSIVLDFAQGALEAAGFTVVATDNPLSVAHLVRRESPDLVVIDVNMPSISGDVVAQIVGSRGLTRKVPVVLHSDLSESELEARATRSGAAGFIRKTGDESSFVASVRKFLPAPLR